MEILYTMAGITSAMFIAFFVNTFNTVSGGLGIRTYLLTKVTPHSCCEIFNAGGGPLKIQGIMNGLQVGDVLIVPTESQIKIVRVISLRYVSNSACFMGEAEPFHLTSSNLKLCLN